MSTVIHFNASALKSANLLIANEKKTKKSSEKLSSGISINRAADNASGLAVSEKMRSQIRGLSQAENNAQDGISLIQTAEGGLNESHAILQRMRELAVQSANGTYQNEVDREAMQLEIDALKAEIDRISESTEYNNINLLDGSLDNGSLNQAEFGALYGYQEYFDSLGQTVTVTSNIAGVSIDFTTGASGVGGENAVWNSTGKMLTIALVKGKSYTDKQINALIARATVRKENDFMPAEVTFASETGSIKLKNGISTLPTVSGERQVMELKLTSFFVNSPDGIQSFSDGYANSLRLTANTYGSSANTPGVAKKISIATDVGAGRESVTITSPRFETAGEEIVLHLSTGVVYSEKDIEMFLAEAGFDYSAELFDESKPETPGYVYFTKALKTDGSAGGIATPFVQNDEILPMYENFEQGEMPVFNADPPPTVPTNTLAYATGYTVSGKTITITGGASGILDLKSLTNSSGVSLDLENMTEADGWVIETGSNANVVIKGESASTQYKGLRISNGAGANLFIENLNITTSDDENIINFTGAGNTLTLIGTNTLKNTNAGADSAVIHAGASTELTVFGNGTLTVESAANGAAIGGNKEESGGTITINSGTINATGDLGSAIGGGYQGGGGNITVNDGTIKAAAGGGGAAIGGGAYGSAGTIKITGGVISGDSTASYGSIIGSGDSGSGGTIEISGTAQIGESGNAINTVGVTSTNAAIGGNGVAVTIKDNAKVYAESQGYGAAIGGENGKEGDVTISGGTVEATAEGTGAAIGGGYQASGGEITISGGDVTATADYSAAIGGGNEGDGGKITVNGGTIKAVVGSGNAAIGGGYDGGAGTIVISGGVISGDSMSAQGSIIGSGQDGSGGTIEISGTAKIGSNTKALTTNGNAAAIGGDTVEIIIKGNAEVYAESQYYGAAIGGSSGKAGDVTIEGGTINAKASNQGAAIGGGRYANGGEITISGGDVTATASAESAAIGGGGSNDWRYTAGAGGNVTIGGTAKVEASHTGGNAAIGGGINSADSSLDGAGSVLAVSGGLLEVTRGTIGTATNPGTNTITEGNIVVPDGTFVADPTNGTNPVYKVEVTGLPMTVGGNLTVPKSGGNYSGIVAEGKKFYMYVPEANEGQEVTFIATNGDEYKATFAADITGGGTKLTFAKVPGDDPSPGPGPSPGRVIPTGVSMTVTTEGKGVGKQFVEKSGGLVLQIGANGVEDQKLTISIGNMSCAGLGIEDVSVDTQENASDSIDIVDDAVKKISLQRASLGALQNRLEHTANNLLTSHENLTAAESQIRDTDMAAEMIKYTTSNILKQAAQSMLAQANQAPQSVLQLLG